MLDRLIALFFALGVIAIPFDAIAGVSALGELSNEGSFYFFAVGIGLYGCKAGGARFASLAHATTGGRILWRIGALILIAMLVSALWNAPDIGAGRFQDRSGSVKLATSAAVLVYGLALASTTCATLPTRWYTCLVLPVCISAILCIGFGSLEALARAGINVPLYSTLNTSLHAGSDGFLRQWFDTKLIEGWDMRLRTVSFEPPAFGNFAGLAWPWLLYAVAITKRLRRVLHVMLLVAFSILIMGAEARTGWLLLGANLLSFGLLKVLFLPLNGHVNKPVAWIAGAVVLLTVAAVIVFYAANLDSVVRVVVGGDSVSDLSRLAYQITAVSIFASSPIFGAGLGQFAFKAALYMPAWGFLSPEIGLSLSGGEAPWPNTYSLYARLAAELGLIGLLGWLAIWVTLILSVHRAALIYAGFGRAVPAIAYPIIMSCVAILVTGVTTDTFRIPMIWITLGAGVCFSARAKQLFVRAITSAPHEITTSWTYPRTSTSR
jgi:O-Antigen ligase